MGDKVLYSVAMGTCPHENNDPFIPSFKRVKTVISPKEIEDPHAAIVIWGGEDISPAIYNSSPIDECWAGGTPSKRDTLEMMFVQYAIEHGIPLIGVCRGAQLLCAMAGGKLYQDVNGHGTGHQLALMGTHRYRGAVNLHTSSMHHQMMYPWTAPEFEMIASAAPVRANVYRAAVEDKMKVAPPLEPEIVFFPQIQGLAIQGHPEFMSHISPFVGLCNQLAQEYCYK